MIRSFIFLLLLALLFGGSPLSAKLLDVGERERTVVSLADGWECAPDPRGDAPRQAWAMQLPEATTLSLPSRWEDSPQTRAYHGAVWYARTLTLPEKLGRSGALLVIDNPVGVLDVYLDGIPCAHFLGNGLTRRIPLTGEAGSSHRLAIRLDARGVPETIRQAVSCGLGEISLEILPPVRLEALEVSMSLPSDTVSIRYRISADEACRAELSIKLLPINSRHALERTKNPITLNLPAGVFEGKFSLPARHMDRWSPSSPRVYRLSAEVSLPGGKVRDSYQVICAPCAAAFSTDRLFLLNGARVILRGLCVPGGAPMPSPPAVCDGLDAELKDTRRGGYPLKLADGIPFSEDLLAVARRFGLAEMLLMRRAGYNALLVDGAALSEDALSLADFLGIMVIADIPPAREVGEDRQESTLQPDIRTMLEELGHHPCIIAWRWSSSGSPTAEIAAIRTLDPYRPVIIRTKDGSHLYTASLTAGEIITDLDGRQFPDDARWLQAVQQAETGESALLISGTALTGIPGTSLLGQQQEQQRLSIIRQAIESIHCAKYPIGYFIRPPRGGAFTGLTTASGSLTQAYFASTAYNNPCLITLRVTKQGTVLVPEVRLINDLGSAGKCQMHRLLTTPANGLTTVMWTEPDNYISVSNSRRQELKGRLNSDIFSPIPITGPGVYRLQYVLSLGAKVFATSQTVTITVDAQAD